MVWPLLGPPDLKATSVKQYPDLFKLLFSTGFDTEIQNRFPVDVRAGDAPILNSIPDRLRKRFHRGLQIAIDRNVFRLVVTGSGFRQNRDALSAAIKLQWSRDSDAASVCIGKRPVAALRCRDTVRVRCCRIGTLSRSECQRAG